MDRSSTWSSGSIFLRANQRGNRKKISWIYVSLIIIFGHQNNLSLWFVVVCLAAGFVFCVFTLTSIHFSQIYFYRWIHERPLSLCTLFSVRVFFFVSFSSLSLISFLSFTKIIMSVLFKCCFLYTTSSYQALNVVEFKGRFLILINGFCLRWVLLSSTF